MRIAIITPALLGLVLAGCGPKELALPADPVDRAATCGVVAAAVARAGTTNIAAPLPFEQQGRIMHYAMLAASEGKAFDTSRAAAVVDRMPQLEGAITGGKWQGLKGACAEAFPATQGVDAVTLPADPLQAQTGCYAMSMFLTKALGAQNAAYSGELGAYGGMNRGLDPKIGAGLVARGIKSDSDAASTLRAEALARMVKLGPPMTVMNACLEKFGPKA
ncbi:hypothetical protein [Sphingomonas sp. KC8]|uniref:hypothetical protein n=1 Tax=Sphingomonas sp. KC8 TaxID=1030157 RepID=UPI0002489BF0|nr:hypothetical protein [Sphingomonas sp. KC8]ARS27854.1 hypothetical protein KC8_11195 [Sphingomonas sp. KC8]